MCPDAADPSSPDPVDPNLRSGDRPTLAAESFWTGSDLVALEAVGSTERYEGAEPLGEGGMGEVLLRTDRRIGRQIAMKLLRRDRAAREGVRSRFLREVRAQGQLEHPSIVPVYDVGVDETGALYFTMRRVLGETLQQIQKELCARSEATVRQYSLHRLLTAFASACLAVDFAHSKGVVHCDLKPANIMLGPYGEVYVLDWGLAQLPAPDGKYGPPASDPTRAKTGLTPIVSGTPGYMAPEQVRGEAFDARADVYALGAILYELLTLEPLHTGADATAVCESTLRGHIKRPTQRAPDRELPPELDLICLRATALEPKDRYASARALHDDLAAYLEGDRDLARRRTLSREHGARARKALERIVSGTRGGKGGEIASRSEALREVGRALALDPNNVDALRAMVELLTQAPRELPPEAHEEIRAEERAMQRSRARAGGIAFLTWMAFVPVFMWQGIRSMPMFLITTAAWGLCSAVCFTIAKHPRPTGFAPIHLSIMGGVAIGFSAVVMGPFVLVPTFAAIFGLAMSLATDRAQRWLPALMATLAMVVPMGLELAGVLPSSYALMGERLCILPRMTSFPPVIGFILLAANIAVVLVGCYFGVHFRGLVNDMQRKLYMHAWQLRQLVPEEARGPLSMR